MKHSISQTISKQRGELIRDLPDLSDILRGSLLQRIIRHRQGCPKCQRGEGHPVAVLAVSYPGPGPRIRQISLRQEQVAEVRRQLENFQRLKAGLEQICELNQKALRPDTAGLKSRRSQRD
jgi:predicted nucleic acid-binding Zn ribbon protein